MEHEELTRIIIGCAIRVHRALGPGFLESVYRNALAHELSKACLEVHCEKRIQVRYDGALVGEFFADMMIQNSVLIENKAVQAQESCPSTKRRRLDRMNRMDRIERRRHSLARFCLHHPVHPVHPVKTSSFRDTRDARGLY